MGCPALDAMRRQMEDAVTRWVASRTSTSCSTTRGRPTRSPRRPRELREAGFAPPTARAAVAPTLLQLQKAVHRCPYCNSTETRLENIFGPTPCRSLRYCDSCRQPFEQFKTI
jgi:ring-1,2-phenylacetyl-CoA epoxidase subunit PaaD